VGNRSEKSGDLQNVREKSRNCRVQLMSVLVIDWCCRHCLNVSAVIKLPLKTLNKSISAVASCDDISLSDYSYTEVNGWASKLQFPVWAGQITPPHRHRLQCGHVSHPLLKCHLQLDTYRNLWDLWINLTISLYYCWGRVDKKLSASGELCPLSIHQGLYLWTMLGALPPDPR